MPTEHEIRWYTHDRPQVPDEFTFVYSVDGNHWEPIEVYGRSDYSYCFAGLVMADPGYIKVLSVISNPLQISEWSEVQTVPEPAWIGLALGVLLLIRFGRKRSVC